MLLVNSGDDSTGTGNNAEVVNPWEERKDRGRVSALVASLVLLATSPRRFFEGTRADAGIWGPLLFGGLITIVLVLLKGVVLTILTLTLPEPALDFVYRMDPWVDRAADAGSDEMPFDFGPGLNALVFLQSLLLFLPLIFAVTLIAMLIVGALVHLLLVVTRTRRPQGFWGTWAAICYANGAVLLGIVPVAGYTLSVVCTAALFGIGLHVVQGIGAMRATLLASILPLLTVLGLLLPRVLEGAAS